MYYVFAIKKSIPTCVHATTEPGLVGGMVLNTVRAMVGGEDSDHEHEHELDPARVVVTKDRAAMTVLYRHPAGPLYNRSVLLITAAHHLLPDEATRAVTDWHKGLLDAKARTVEYRKLQEELVTVLARLVAARP